MRKLKLEVESLAVETFVPADAPARPGGTVLGQQQSRNCPTERDCFTETCPPSVNPCVTYDLACATNDVECGLSDACETGDGC